MNKFILGIGAVICMMSAGCSMRGFKPPPDPWESYVRKDRKASFEEVKRELLECGYEPLSYGNPPDKNTDNENAARMECMFSKGYVFASGWGGLCSRSELRGSLPACANAPIRPRYR